MLATVSSRELTEWGLYYKILASEKSAANQQQQMSMGGG